MQNVRNTALGLQVINLLVVVFVGAGLLLSANAHSQVTRNNRTLLQRQAATADEVRRALFLLDCYSVAATKFPFPENLNRQVEYRAWVDECFTLNGVHPSTAIRLPPDPVKP